MADLLGRSDVEFCARHAVDVRFGFGSDLFEFAAKIAEVLRVDADAVVLHFYEGIHQRNFHVVEQVGQSLFGQNGFQLLAQLQGDVRILSGVFDHFLHGDIAHRFLILPLLPDQRFDAHRFVL